MTFFYTLARPHFVFRLTFIFMAIAAAGANVAASSTGLVANAYGNLTSSPPAVAAVQSTLPTIVAQPTNQFVVPHGAASFQVVATGSAPIFYQWRFNGTNLLGATNGFLGIANADLNKAGGYSVIVSNSFGQIVSRTVSLTVAPLWIAGPPQSTNVVFSYPFKLSVDAGGTPPVGYQWLANGHTIRGVSGPVLSVPAAGITNTGEYVVIVANPSGRVTSSPPAVVSVLPPYSFGTLAGSGAPGYGDGAATNARFNGLIGIVVDAGGNVFVSESQNAVIRKIGTNGAVATFAGTSGLHGSADGTGFAARFNSPGSIAIDRDGNLYVADFDDNIIRKITPNRVVSTLAGTAGVKGSTDGPGSVARFSFPDGIAVDDNGVVYVADVMNNTIRTIRPDGTVSTLAGLAGGMGSTNGVGAGARFSGPNRVAVDRLGNVYITDGRGTTIRKIDPDANVTTLAGAPFSARQVDGVGASARFSQLNGIAVDAAGLLYVVDGPNGRICRITPDGAVTTLAGASSAGFADGAGSAAIFSQPYGVAVDGAGRLYVSDSDNNRVRIGVFGFDPAIIISPQDQSAEAGYPVALSAFAVGAQPLSYQWRQNGIDLAGATNASFAITFSQPTNAGSYSLVVTNALGSVTSSPPAIVTIAAVPPAIAQQPISQTSPAGSNVFLSVSASGSPPLRFQWQFNGTNLVGATNATLFLGSAPTNDTGMYTVVVSNAFGVETSHVAALTVAEIGITELPQDSEIVLGYPFNLGVAAFGNPMIGYQWQFDGTNIPGAFTSSLILTNVSFADGGDYRSIVFDLIPTNGYVLRAPIGAPKATLTVVPPYDFVTLAGTNVAGAVDGDGTSAQFNMPTGIVVDKDGFVYVSDASNHTIRKITPSGTVTTFAGLAGSPGAVDGAIVDARFNRPNGIAIDGSGNLYVADRGNATIRKISSDGTVVTFAGSAGLRGYQDGIGPAARFFTPLNVACDRVGNVYVADETLRKVTPEGVVTTLAGPPGVNGQPIADAYGMAPDALGNLYISEDFKLTIALIGPDGLVTPVAGLFRTPGATNGSGAFARFSAPSGMAMDLSGNMFLADASLIRKITPGGVVTTIAGLEGISGFADGSGQAALFNQPLGIAVDGAGTVYVADTRNNAIRVGRPPLTSLPSLQIAWNGNQAVISWPVSTVGFVLETSPTLLARSWAAITDGITISGDQSVFQTNVNASPAFFRLRRQ